MKIKYDLTLGRDPEYGKELNKHCTTQTVELNNH